MELKLNIVREAISEKKAYNTTLIDVHEVSSVTDYFFICSGQSPIQVRAIIDNILKRMQDAGYPLPTKEGYQEGRWVLLDYGNLIVHVMQQSERDFYALESLWHDAKIITI